MARLKRLDQIQIQRGLKPLPGWRFSRNALRRQYRFETFKTAIHFVNAVAAEAEGLNHHPDIDIRFSRVRVALSTHDVGGISSRDLHLARLIEGQARRRHSV